MTSSSEFDLAYARFYAPIRAKCLRLLANRQAADDVAQEAFLRMWQWSARPPVDAPGGGRTILAWLYRTCTRLAIDTLRERRRVVLDEPALTSLPCGADPGGAAAARAAVAALAGAVSDAELEAAVLCRVDGLSQPEAALVLGLSERSVRRLLARFDAQTAQVRQEFSR